MFLARVEYGSDIKVYELSKESGARCGGWQFKPKLGAEGRKMPSGLCNGGWAAVAGSAAEAASMVESLRVRGAV